MGFDVKVDGIWLRSLGHVSAVKWSTAWGTGPCGSRLASCAVAVAPTADSPLLRIGRPFEVWAAGVKVFGGVTTEPGRGFPWTLNARGYAMRAGDFQAVDATGNPTTKAETAAVQAVANGLEWSGVTAFPDDSIGVDDEVPTMTGLDALLDSTGILKGKRWGTDVDGVAFWASDPTSPTWLLDASDLELGVASDGLYTRVRARYVTSVDPGTGEADGWASIEVPVDPVNDPAVQMYGSIWFPMDLTGLTKPLLGGDAEATSYAAQQLALLTVPQWANRVTVDSSRLLTPGGHPAHLPSVRAGQMVRLFNVPNSLGGLRNELAVDVVLGEVEFDAENPTEVTLAPVGLAVRNVADMARQAAEVAKKVGVGSKFVGQL